MMLSTTIFAVATATLLAVPSLGAEAIARAPRTVTVTASGFCYKGGDNATAFTFSTVDCNAKPSDGEQVHTVPDAFVTVTLEPSVSEAADTKNIEAKLEKRGDATSTEHVFTVTPKDAPVATDDAAAGNLPVDAESFSTLEDKAEFSIVPAWGGSWNETNLTPHSFPCETAAATTMETLDSVTFDENTGAWDSAFSTVPSSFGTGPDMVIPSPFMSTSQGWNSTSTMAAPLNTTLCSSTFDAGGEVETEVVMLTVTTLETVVIGGDVVPIVTTSVSVDGPWWTHSLEGWNQTTFETVSVPLSTA